MKDLKILIAGIPTNVARSALYYASRYIKQASSFESYSKDIFDEDQNSRPDDTVRFLTHSLIKFIEEQAGMKVAAFPVDVNLNWMDRISGLELSLGPELNDEEIQKAKNIIESMVVPTMRSV